MLGYVLAGARVVARRVALFVARRGAFVGWSCNVEFGDAATLVALGIHQDAPTVLSWAAAEGTYLGPLDPSAHRSLMAVMQHASRDVAAVALRVNGRTAVVILADQLGDTLIATKRLEEESPARPVRPCSASCAPRRSNGLAPAPPSFLRLRRSTLGSRA